MYKTADTTAATGSTTTNGLHNLDHISVAFTMSLATSKRGEPAFVNPVAAAASRFLAGSGCGSQMRYYM
jgi:hypothetical protein